MIPVVPLRGTGNRFHPCPRVCAALHPRLFEGDRYAAAKDITKGTPILGRLRSAVYRRSLGWATAARNRRLSVSAFLDAAGRRTGLQATVGGAADFQNSYAYAPLGRLTRVTTLCVPPRPLR